MVANWPIYDEFLRLIALFEQLLVPLTMAWLALRWFWLVRKTPHEKLTKALEEQIEKAAKATRRAFVGGLLLAVLIVLLVMRLCPGAKVEDAAAVQGVLQLATWSTASACVLGFLAGLAVWWAGRSAENWRINRLLSWCLAVVLATGIAVSSLVTYYMFPNYFWPHAWLVCLAGLGLLLPVRDIVHCTSPWRMSHEEIDTACLVLLCQPAARRIEWGRLPA